MHFELSLLPRCCWRVLRAVRADRQSHHRAAESTSVALAAGQRAARFRVARACADGDRPAWFVGGRSARHRRSRGTCQRVREGAHAGARRNGLSHVARDRLPRARAAAVSGVRCDRSPGRLGYARRRQRRADAAAGRPRPPAQQCNVDGRVSRGSGDAPALRRLLEPRGAPPLGGSTGAMPVSGEPAAKAELAAAYGAAQPPYVANAIQTLCRDASKAPDSVRLACNAAGTATAQRAATWSLRVAGAGLAERSASAGPPQAAAQQLLADIQRRAFECVEAGDSGRARARISRPRRAFARRRRVGKAARAGRAAGRSRGVCACRGACKRLTRNHVACTVDGANTQPAMRQLPSCCRCIWYKRDQHRVVREHEA